MSKYDKLLQRIKLLNKNLRFDEIKKVLEAYGYKMYEPGSGSSHRTFRKDGCTPITIPVHEPIKLVYVIMVKEVVEASEDEVNDEEND